MQIIVTKMAMVSPYNVVKSTFPIAIAADIASDGTSVLFPLLGTLEQTVFCDLITQPSHVQNITILFRALEINEGGYLIPAKIGCYYLPIELNPYLIFSI